MNVGPVEPLPPPTPHGALRALDKYFARHPRDGQSTEIKAAMDRLWTLVIEGK